MAVAVDVYERLMAMQTELVYGSDDDFIFLPHHQSREFAIKELARMFRVVCTSAGPAVSKSGEPRTLYSLRHTAITFRLLKGNVDIITLARAARTSAEIINRFYARDFTAEMNVEELQSMR